VIRDPLTHCRLWYFEQVQFISRAVNGTLIFVVVDVKLARPTPHGVAALVVPSTRRTTRDDHAFPAAAARAWNDPGHICSNVIFAQKPTLPDVDAHLKRSAHAASGLATNCAQ